MEQRLAMDNRWMAKKTSRLEDRKTAGKKINEEIKEKKQAETRLGVFILLMENCLPY